jgi:diguanylate cyclase (GGDEF)-like protein
VVIRPAKNAPWLPLAALRRRPLPALPAGLAGYLVALVGLATGLAAVGLSTTPVRVVHLVTWAALVGAGVVCMELTRAAGQPAGLSRDLLSAWKIPVALLLPPVYALVTATLFVTLQQRRVRPGLMHRRVLSAAALGLADGAASLLFHWLLPPQTSPASWFVHRPLAALGAGVLCGLVGNALSAVLLATAARLSSPEISWRSVLSDQQDLALDLGEICAGVLVAGATALTPAAVLIALPPVLLLHRALSHAQLVATARTDAKTGLLTAAAWQAETEREIVRASREHRPLAVLIADLDHFKGVNDTHGHLVGDRVLAAVAQALRAGLRPYDLPGRFGGEEFTVALPNTDQAEATRIAERLRRNVAGALLVLDEMVTVAVTVSIGGAVLGTHGRDLTDLLTAADLALYRAKSAGRNQVDMTAGSGDQHSGVEAGTLSPGSAYHSTGSPGS